MKIIERILCKHEWTNRGFSSIKCIHCGKTKYNPKKNSEILNETLTKMESKGVWKSEDIANMKSKYKIK